MTAVAPAPIAAEQDEQREAQRPRDAPARHHGISRNERAPRAIEARTASGDVTLDGR